MFRFRLLTVVAAAFAVSTATAAAGESGSARTPGKAVKRISAEIPSSSGKAKPHREPIGVEFDLRPRDLGDKTPTNPLGEWHRELGPISQHLVVEHGSFRALTAHNEDNAATVVELRADYSITDDGLVYGVLTGVRIELHGEEKSDLDQLVQRAKLQNALLDEPFSFRWRVNGDSLMIKDVKFAGSGLEGEIEEFAEMASFYATGEFRKPKPASGK